MDTSRHVNGKHGSQILPKAALRTGEPFFKYATGAKSCYILSGSIDLINHRRGDQKAIIAVANKMLKIIWFMLTRREQYESRNEKRYQQKLNSIND